MVPVLSIRRCSILILVSVMLLFVFCCSPSPAAASGSLTVNQVSAQPQSVDQGETVRVTVKWTNQGDDVSAEIRCERNATSYAKDIVLIKAESGEAVVDFAIGRAADPGPYTVTVSAAGYQDPWDWDGVFTVKEVIEASITSPTRGNPAFTSPGDSVTIRYDYHATTETEVFVRLAKDGTVVASDKDTLKGSSSGSTTLNIPSTASLGKYDLTIVTENDELLDDQEQSVILEPKLDAVITSPTRTSPVSALPGDRITVQYDYEVFDDVTADVCLLKSGGGVVVSATEQLYKGSNSGSASLTIPEKTALGRYDLEIRAEGRSLHTQNEAVAVEHRITADITSPTRSKSESLNGGEKVTIDFKYTASDKTKVNVKLQNGDVLVERSVSLDKTTRSKSGSVTLTIPKDADPGDYDVVIENPVSEVILDTERDAVTVDAKITADITSPTKSKPLTVRAGGSLRVEFEYTSNADSEVEILVLDADDSELASRTISIDETGKKKSKTVSVKIPSRTETGTFDVIIKNRSSDTVLATQTQAVSVEDPVKLNIESPTTNDPAGFNIGDRLQIKLSYTAEENSSVQLNVLKADGKTLVSSTISLPKTSRSRTETVTLNMGGATPMESYDLEVVNRNTGSTLALETEALQAVSYPLDVEVRFVIGQNGRWVNGTYQSVDLAPRIIENRTLLPIRHVGEPLGWRFTWDGETKLATVTKGKKQVRVWVNNHNAQVSDNNGFGWRTERIDPENPSVQPVLMSGRVLLPLRFVSETLDTQVDWNAATQAVTVSQG